MKDGQGLSGLSITANSCIDATFMIQIIEKQDNGWHMVIHGQPCYFTRQLDLYTTGLLPLPANTDNGLRWRINRKWVSYRQIKKIILQFK